jgi:sugar phosphate isomerase/epimerase
MRTLQGPALFLAQFLGDEPPFDDLDSIAAWAADLGFKGLQIPCGDKRVFDLDAAATSKSWCDDFRARLDKHGLVVTELSSHIRGQLVAVHPAYDELFDAFTPEVLRGKPLERATWAAVEVKKCLSASANLGLDVMATFSGSLAWPYLYPWPQRPPGLIDEAFRELTTRWRPILDHADAVGVDCAFELHPSEDLFDGATFERFLALTDDHPRANILYDPSHFVLQGLDYLAFIELYHERIKAFHVKDAELRPDGRTGVYGGYLDWPDRAGRFRSLGDGEIDFGGIFTALAKYDFGGWAVLEWECAFKDAEVGAREGAAFIEAFIIEVAKHSFDDFAGTKSDATTNRRILGLDR